MPPSPRCVDCVHYTPDSLCQPSEPGGVADRWVGTWPDVLPDDPQTFPCPGFQCREETPDE